MNKRSSALLASVLLTFTLALGGCGGAANQTNNSGDNTSQEASNTSAKQENVDPQEKFLGTWMLAKIESNGITMMGSFENMFDSEEGMVLSIFPDGEGSLSFDDDENSFSWTLKDDNTISITPIKNEQESDDSPLSAMDISYDKDINALSLEMNNEGTQMQATFSLDGTLESVDVYDLSSATEVTAIDQITGAWKICGAGMNGAIVLGNGDSLKELMGDSFDPTLNIASDGTTTMSGEDSAKIEIGEDGAILNDTYTNASVKLLDNKLILDLSELMQTEFFMMYEK